MAWKNGYKQLMISVSIYNENSETEGTNISILESIHFHFKFQWHTEGILFWLIS